MPQVAKKFLNQTLRLGFLVPRKSHNFLYINKIGRYFDTSIHVFVQILAAFQLFTFLANFVRNYLQRRNTEQVVWAEKNNTFSFL